VHHNAGALQSAVEPARLVRSIAMVVAFTLALLLWAEDAEARLGLSFDSGVLWMLMPTPLANSAPVVVAELDHSGAAQPTHPGGSLGGLFNRPGLIAGFAAGFLGAGLLGLLFGQGLSGGLGGVASFLGLIFQLALLLLLVRLIWTWWSGRNAPAFAGLSPRQQAEAYLRSRNESLPGVYPASPAADATTDGEAIPSATASRSGESEH
jgi:predicted lipid-binding transport protein (Tim44 family)